MDHVAIMNKSWQLIPKVISGEKKIESRWYQTRRTPWGKIFKNDTVYFKNSGEMITAKAVVSWVMQFELKGLSDAQIIVDKYGKEICLVNNNIKSWGSAPKYCVLIKLSGAELIKEPFQINKKGFGCSAAWLTVNDISKIKI